MTASVGFAEAACAECGCDANSYHCPGCSFAPYVCPGCYAVDEPCAPGCIDAELEAEREESAWEDDTVDLNDAQDWEYVP